MVSSGCCCKCECSKTKLQKKDDGEENKSWQNFTQEVTMHGIRYVHQGGASVSYRVTWLVAVLFMLAYATGASYDLFSSLARKETTTKLKNTRVQRLQFPSVVFCDHNGFQEDAVRDAIEQLNLTGLDNLLNEYYNPFVAESEKVNWSLPEFENLAHLTSAEWENLLFALTPAPKSSILYASFGSLYGLDISEEFQRIMTDLGPCFIFNKDGKHFSEFTGIQSGLTLSISTDVSKYWSGPLVNTNGFTIALYEPGDVPFMNSDGFIGLTPGTSSDIVITQTKYFRHPPPADNNTANCYDTENLPNYLTAYPTYTYNGCLRECNTKYFNHSCGCRPIDSVAVDGIEICSPKLLIECIKNIDWEKYMVFAVTENCDCPPPCREIHYDAQSATYQAPNVNFANRTFGESAYIWQKKNMITTRIAYKSMSYDTLEERQAFSLIDIIANIGGTLGVCVGASALTICEFIQFGVQAVTRKFTQRKKNASSTIHVMPLETKHSI